VSVQRGYDLRDFALIAYGGAGPLHAGALARECGIGRVVVPAHSGAFSALGCLVSPLRYDAVQTHRARLDGWDAKIVGDRFRTLETQCMRPLLDEGHALDRVSVTRSADLRYVGQNYELEIEFGDGSLGTLRAAFERRHRLLYGYATGEGVECVNLRVSASVARETMVNAPPPVSGSPALLGHHPAYFRETGQVSLPRYDRGALGTAPVDGPALVEDEWSTTVVYPGQRCAADARGHLVIDTGAGA
jgi:N-methylhydantoinase A